MLKIRELVALSLKGDETNCKPDEGGFAAFIWDVICEVRVNSDGGFPSGFHLFN